MKIVIDADGCPVIPVAIEVAGRHGLEVLLVADTAHSFAKYKVPTKTVEKGSDSADFAIANLIAPGDLVVTQDYGLAALILSRKGLAIHQSGMLFTEENIDGLLLSRHMAQKVRRAGGRLRGPAKRKKEEDVAFERALEELIKKQTL